MTSTLFTRTQVAQMFGVKYNTVYKWERDGIIAPVFYVRKRPRYSMAALECIAVERKVCINKELV